MQSQYAYPAGAYFCSCKSRQNTLGAVPQGPLAAKLRLDTNDVNIVRTAPQIRSQGACGAFYFGFCRDRIKNQPYKRRRVGRNLRLNRADPALCSGQPSPLRCILLSPQGLTTLWGPQKSHFSVGHSQGSCLDLYLRKEEKCEREPSGFPFALNRC